MVECKWDLESYSEFGAKIVVPLLIGVIPGSCGGLFDGVDRLTPPLISSPSDTTWLAIANKHSQLEQSQLLSRDNRVTSCAPLCRIRCRRSWSCWQGLNSGALSDVSNTGNEDESLRDRELDVFCIGWKGGAISMLQEWLDKISSSYLPKIVRGVTLDPRKLSIWTTLLSVYRWRGNGAISLRWKNRSGCFSWPISVNSVIAANYLMQGLLSRYRGF